MATGTIKPAQNKLVVYETVSSSTSCAASGLTVIYSDISVSGYVPIAVVGFYMTGLSKGTMRSVYLVQNNTDGTDTAHSSTCAVAEVYNANTSAQNAVVRFHVLYEKQ